MVPKKTRPAGGGTDADSRAKSSRRTEAGHPGGSPLLGFIRARLIGKALSPVSGLMTSIPLFFACLLLMIGWKVGPQRTIDAARLRKLTSHTEGRIVESWMALDWNPAATAQFHDWRPLAKASWCVVVEYDAGWSNQIRRAFCGPSSTYNDSLKLEDVHTISPHVPFVWARDANGFIVPEIRMSKATRTWLATHPEPDPLPNDPPTKSALDSLRLDFDRPAEYAAAGWTRPAATIPLLFDPKDPRGARPAGFVAEAQDLPPVWLSFGLFALFLVAGGAVWIVAITLLLGEMRRWAFWIVAIVPLIALPWWGERMPHLVSSLNARVGDVLRVFLDDVERWGYLASSDPNGALMAHGEKVSWRLDQSLYAGTLGRFRFAPPSPAPKSADAASHLLTESLAEQVRGLDPSEQTALFVRLRQEKENKLTGDGPAFFAAARQTMADPGAPSDVRRAANAFLEAWGSYFNYPKGTR